MLMTVADLSLSTGDKQAITAAANCLKHNFPIERILLYGSKATGTDTEESDIDLLVLTTGVLSWQERDAITEALFDIELDYDVVISTLVVEHTQWDAGPYTVLPIHQEVEKHSVAI